jgi:hypothetical protein
MLSVIFVSIRPDFDTALWFKMSFFIVDKTKQQQQQQKKNGYSFAVHDFIFCFSFSACSPPVLPCLQKFYPVSIHG